MKPHFRQRRGNASGVASRRPAQVLSEEDEIDSRTELTAHLPLLVHVYIKLFYLQFQVQRSTPATVLAVPVSELLASQSTEEMYWGKGALISSTYSPDWSGSPEGRSVCTVTRVGFRK